LSGTSQTQLTEIKNLYDSGAVVDLSLYDVNLVAELLLAYLRDLPEQIIPLEVDEVGGKKNKQN
jgi:archaellum biogenesis ATPase FlaH